MDMDSSSDIEEMATPASPKKMAAPKMASSFGCKTPMGGRVLVDKLVKLSDVMDAIAKLPA